MKYVIAKVDVEGYFNKGQIFVVAETQPSMYWFDIYDTFNKFALPLKPQYAINRQYYNFNKERFADYINPYTTLEQYIQEVKQFDTKSSSKRTG